MKSSHFKSGGWISRSVSVATVSALLVSMCGAQTLKQRQPESPVSQELNQYPDLLPELGRLVEKIQRDIHFPGDRQHSTLAPLLPASTTFYFALPNYGTAVHQSLGIFQDELKQSPDLRNWWEQSEVGKNRAELEDAIEKFSQLFQFVGDEVVVAGDTARESSNFLILSEVRKPGLKEYLKQISQASKSKTHLRILDLKELSTATSPSNADEFVVLIRPDYVIASPKLEAVRKLNHSLDARSGSFASTPFGQRVLQSYTNGVSLLGAGDLHSIVSQIPQKTAASDAMFERSGFKDLKYFVWQRRQSGASAFSESELSFTAPRHGAAAWLATPTTLGGLDFVSPKAAFVMSLSLKNFAEIFDDIRDMATASKPNAFASITPMEQAMHISLRNDLLALLQGEITIEMKDITDDGPAWRVIMKVSDPERLQATLNKLLQSAPVQMRQFERLGVHYHSLVIPNPRKQVEIVYTFADGYWILASSRELATGALTLHKSGTSLAKSSRFLASIPPGYSAQASAVFYQDPTALTAIKLRRLVPELGSSLLARNDVQPATFVVYGEDSAIRTVSSSGAADAGAVLVVAAIAIPNLLRARMAANESAAESAVRTANTAQIAYVASYPNKGYAPDLATLGPDPKNPKAYSQQHAALIDDTLGHAACTGHDWCLKSGYNLNVSAECLHGKCGEYVVTAAPVSASTGTRNFCSVSDAIVRYQAGPPVPSPVSAAECQTWAPVK